MQYCLWRPQNEGQNNSLIQVCNAWAWGDILDHDRRCGLPSSLQCFGWEATPANSAGWSHREIVACIVDMREVQIPLARDLGGEPLIASPRSLEAGRRESVELNATGIREKTHVSARGLELSPEENRI